jgi:hypothetical protein
MAALGMNGRIRVQLGEESIEEAPFPRIDDVVILDAQKADRPLPDG